MSLAPSSGCRCRSDHSRAIGLAGLVEDLRGHSQLADVVEQRRPAEAVGVVLAQPHVGGDQVRERPHSFAVTSCAAIVSVERGGEREHSLSGLRRRDIDRRSRGVDVVRPPLELTDRAGAERDRETRRCLVGEAERELEQARERQEAAAKAFGEEDHGEGDEPGQHPADRTELLGSDPVCDGPRGCDRQDDGDERGGDAHRERDAVSRLPTVCRPPIGIDLVRHRCSCRRCAGSQDLARRN